MPLCDQQVQWAGVYLDFCAGEIEAEKIFGNREILKGGNGTMTRAKSDAGGRR
jgi:hypothetical protein